ncbi:hypothetical protein BUALT_Bualt08G0066500 [Buddleja alternifolia]|uniref:Uncharacterized protein n=1 Tax=Buddleja alternifolia TaxID=168488 RepID=A0AAV6XFB9_9LAMI|nr:hypothetical protein BUALT_Bualt08G0066500 [Buddleja alternifolia]
MELRSCDARYFIRTIRGGLVIKVRNINSRASPAIRFKSLKDIYESEDAKRLGRPSGLMTDREQVKCEYQCFPVADRTLREIKTKNDEFIPCADDAVDSDLDDNTTLKQLWKRSLTKKRKYSQCDDNSKLDNAYENPIEDEPDLHEPLINWKSRCSKNSKAKKKRRNQSGASSSTIAAAIKSEKNLDSEGSLQFGAELAPVICVKVEVPDADQLGCQDKTSSDNDSPIGHNEVLNPGDVTSKELQNMVLCEYREPLFSVYEYQDSVDNETSCDHLEGVEPIAMLLPWDGMTVKLETLQPGYEELLDLPPLAIKNGNKIGEAHSCRVSPFEDQNSDGYVHSRSSSSMKEFSEESCSGIQVPDMSMRLQQEFGLVLFEDEAKADSSYEQGDYSMSIPDKKCGSYLGSVISLKTEHKVVPMGDAIADAEQPSTCSLDAITKSGLNCGSQIEDALLKAEGAQTSASSCTDPESKSLKNQTCDSADTLSTPESRQPPERLLSTRQAISPTSQERLCLAMNSVEPCNETDQYKRNGKLFEKQTGKKVSPVRSETQHAKYHGLPGQFNQRKVIISHRNIIKKSQIAKGNLEGPRFSRTLPNLSSGCASIQGCSESAIAFSQRQMHDMESLAVKLMNELKSMKDIVEQKLLFEAYRNVSLKNDADEVKSAINNATKVEEMARKWMSIMTRDCNRFCKIMKMTPNSTAASKDTVPRGKKKKIVFADEAGGKLCHVKLLEDRETSPTKN